MKKYLVLLLIFFICYNSNGEVGKNSLNLIKIEQDLELKDMILSDVVAILSKESGKSIVVDDKSKDIKLDMFFSKGENLKDILETICITNDLKLKEMANIIVISEDKTATLGEFSLAGQVLDEEYNKGIENVKVIVKDVAVDSVTTISDGNFIINNLNPGIYMVKFEKAGYESASKIIKLIENIGNIEIRMRKNRKSQLSQNSNLKEENFREIYSKRIKLKNVNSKEIEEMIKNIYGDIVDTIALEKNSSIVVTGNEKLVGEIEDFIKDIDRDIK